ncbi:MAG: carbohydrate porin [Alphaproteobacteria bacterium]|nr:carbohydrate porin [Alphaproteobacteria bacterium]
MRTNLSALAIFGALILVSAGEPVAAEEGFFTQDKLTGDWGGVRKQWQDAGVDFELDATLETLSNPTGGIRKLTIYQGLLEPSLNLDLETAANWPGASFYIDAYQISGRGLSRNAIGNLLTVSSIEALSSTRLHELWFQQELLDRRVSLRVGQIALDREFYISQYAAGFVNSTFGCPDILPTDLPGGASCYPLATPGARFRVTPTEGLTLSVAALNGSSAPPGPGDPEVRNASGTNFLIGEDGFLPIAELAYAFDEEPTSSTRLSDIKLGAWYHTADFSDTRRDNLGRSLADPTSTGIPATHGSNFGAYLILDKMLWRRPDTATQGLAAFLRVGYAPPDRNLISLEIDAGLTFKGLLPGRGLDVLGVGLSYARIGYARRLDRDQILFTDIERPVRNYESVLEVTYEAQLAPWWLLQPDLQLVAHPGGHVAPPPPAPAGRPIPNALVIGLRSTFTF